MKDKKYVVLDIETNGFYFELFHEVIEVAAIRYENGEKKEVFHQYIKPWKKVPKDVEDLTGITNEFLEDKPNRWQVLPGLRRFIGDSIVVAYNNTFDVPFLNHYFLDLKLEPITKSICAYKTFKNITGRKKNAKLIDACEYYGIDLSNAHSAIDDTEATLSVFIKELEEQESNPEKEFIIIEEETKREVYVKDLKRILNANPNKSVKTELLKKEPNKDIRNKIITEEDKKEVISYFESGEMIPIISTLTLFNEYEIMSLFLTWVNEHNITKYASLVNDKLVKNILMMLEAVDNNLEDLYDMHQEIFKKKSAAEDELVPINKFIYKLVKKLYIDTDDNEYSLEDFRLYFDSGKTLGQILKESNSSIELYDLMGLFAEWLVENNTNRELYRSYIRSNILFLEELKLLVELGVDGFINNHPNISLEKVLLTDVLYKHKFFKI